jgi:hypothetical protein
MAHFSFVAHSGWLGLSGLLAHLGVSIVGRGYFYATLSFDLSAELVAHFWLAILFGAELVILYTAELETELLAHLWFSTDFVVELLSHLGFGTHCDTCFLVGGPHTTGSLTGS